MRPATPAEDIPSQGLVLASPPVGTRSGIDWEVAVTGVRLWVNAKAQVDQGRDSFALRSMHIDALRYMHIALPTDLTPVEIQSLQASMSTQLNTQAVGALQNVPRQPNMLRHTVAQVMCWIITGLLVILPILMTLLNRLLQFERQHQLTERVIANSLVLTSTLGNRGAELHSALVRFKGGRTGGACAEVGMWLIEGLIGGVNDGIDAVVQSRRNSNRSGV